MISQILSLILILMIGIALFPAISEQVKLVSMVLVGVILAGLGVVLSVFSKPEPEEIPEEETQTPAKKEPQSYKEFVKERLEVEEMLK